MPGKSMVQRIEQYHWLLLGALATVLLLVFTILAVEFAVSFGPNSVLIALDRIGYYDFLRDLHFWMMFVTPIPLIVCAYHILNTDRLGPMARPLWFVALFMVFPIPGIIYWWLHIRPGRRPVPTASQIHEGRAEA